MALSTKSETAKEHLFEAVVLKVAELWHAYLVPLPKLPLAIEKRPELLQYMQQFLKILSAEMTYERSVFLQLDELHQDNAIRNISRYGRQWSPQMGLGLLPEAPPPRYWTTEDLLERDYTSTIPALMHSVMHLDTDNAGTKSACEVMTGTAGLIQVLHTCNAAQLLQGWFDVFQPTIQEEGLAAYPLYLPLISGTCIANCTSENLDRWMADAQIYIRESAEDKGILILSRFNLEKLLEKTKKRLDETIPASV
ncbi:hypothetical protein [Granulicella arctica]|uniref:Uncharacterized protein n=1 Tax=Granulicella arctica TaxID=940613 RepID=A0A7Y9PEX1_9BACT|nr:hypothetical protein [Granulicella arctica]NYF78653.1 hypothetical protein [Granulicella arctica]